MMVDEHVTGGMRGGANPVRIDSLEHLENVLRTRAEAAIAATPSLAGKPYCPGSGTEGMAFEEAFCCNCVYYGNLIVDNSCPIAMQAQTVADATDPTFPNQWVYDDTGRPTCRMFERADRATSGDEPRAAYERHMYERAMRGE